MIQDLTEGDVALEEAADQLTPLGLRHLHWVHRDGGGHWLVRGQKRTSLCGTPRCRLVMILEYGRRGEGINVEAILPGPDQEPVPEQHASDCPECIAHEREQFETPPSLRAGIGPVPQEGYREF